MKRNEIKDDKGRFKRGEVEYLRRRDSVPIICGIYKITNPKNEVYIGGSRTIYRRWLRHREARKKIKIHLSIKEYGWRNHDFKIIHQLPIDISDEILLRYEQLYIDAYKSCNTSMLNVKDAGSKAKFSEESRKRMSLAQQGKTPWNIGKSGVQRAWNKGIHVSRKKYKFIFNDDIIEISDLKQHCEKSGINYDTMIHFSSAKGFYKNNNYYKGYKRIE